MQHCRFGADEVMGTSLRLDIDPTDVFTEHTNTDELNTAEEEDRNDQRGETWGIYSREQGVENNHQGIDQAQKGDNNSDAAPNLQRQHREGENAVKGITPKL